MANRNIYHTVCDAGSKKKKQKKPQVLYKMCHSEIIKRKGKLILPPHTSDSGVFLLAGKHSLNHLLFSPCQDAFIRLLAHTVNNFHTPFSFHLIKRDLRDHYPPVKTRRHVCQ